ncbi:hypothetical protein EF148_15030 [Stenotrophomonas maltophilia]|uniref:Transmembrane protein n=1 Tax=Stenotrophomonas maltophilia TaxID=40324 RepID=A0A2J0UCJ9_STEMA|nr:hypothetical protein [Stenotrophomonas maltophilia]PJL31172.1 hypothetical protein B9Y64_06165 [Stenotrophomonas maltophilia]
MPTQVSAYRWHCFLMPCRVCTMNPASSSWVSSSLLLLAAHTLAASTIAFVALRSPLLRPLYWAARNRSIFIADPLRAKKLGCRIIE